MMMRKDNMNEDNLENYENSPSIILPEMKHSSSRIIICSTKEELQQMQHKKALDPRYTCNLCGKKYSSQSSLKVHKIRHRKKEDLPFHCLFCSYKSATKRDLERHHNQHIGHARQVDKCDLCSKIFKISSSLTEHIKSVHTKETTYQCGKCDFTTERRSTFRIHLNNHNEARVKIICPICGSCFQNKSNLKIHLMTHADAKPFACNQCNQKFTLSNRLLSHQQAVHGPKIFECKTCAKQFPSVHRLNRHTLIHTGERPFKCCFCSHTSNTQGNLLKHVRHVHAMLHFTYKDVLKESGQKIDPKQELNQEEKKKLVERGKECAELHLKKLRAKGLTCSSLEQLQQDLNFKKEAKASMMVKMQEKREKIKKKSNDCNRKKRNKIDKKPKIEKEKQKKGLTESFEISNCEDFILPRIADGNYILPSNAEGVDVLPMTSPIHVIWNVGIDNGTKKNFGPSLSPKKVAPKISPKKNRKNLKRKSTCGEVIKNNVNLSHISDNLNSSAILEDHLSFNDKPSLLNHLQENASPTDLTNPVLGTPLLNNVDHLVDFETIESPNTIVVTTEAINDFDPMCKNLDLYQQLLPMNDEAHFMSAIDPSTENDVGRDQKVKEENQREIASKDTEKKASIQGLENHFHSQFVRNKIQPVSQQKNLKSADYSSQHLNTGQVDCSNAPLMRSDNASLSDKYIRKVVINCKSNRDSESGKKSRCANASKNEQNGIDLLQPEEVIILQGNNDKISQKLISNSEIHKCNQPVREITIKNSISSYSFLNDQMDVMSIAEIDESDKDIVLVIDTLD